MGGEVSPDLDPRPATRLEAAWLHRWWVLAAAVLAAGLVGILITMAPSSFAATASVRVSVAQTRAGQHEAALGSNELAAQYALLADSQPVRQAAQRLLGALPLGSVSASPSSGYNLISLSATASSSSAAGRQASAVASALVTYLRDANTAQAAATTAAAIASQQGLDVEIASLRSDIAKLRTDIFGALAVANLGSLQDSLASAVTARQNLLSGNTADVTGGTPAVTAVDLPDRGTLVSKHRVEYALIALVVGLLVAVELAYLATTATGRRSARQAGQAGNLDEGTHSPPMAPVGAVPEAQAPAPNHHGSPAPRS
jgi:hypothetical protein